MSGSHHVTVKAECDRYETARRVMSGKISSAIPAPRRNPPQGVEMSAAMAPTRLPFAISDVLDEGRFFPGPAADQHLTIVALGSHNGFGADALNCGNRSPRCLSECFLRRALIRS